MLSITYERDPLQRRYHSEESSINKTIKINKQEDFSQIVTVSCPLHSTIFEKHNNYKNVTVDLKANETKNVHTSQRFYSEPELLETSFIAFKEGKRSAQIALADYIARHLMEIFPLTSMSKCAQTDRSTSDNDNDSTCIIGNWKYNIQLEMLDQKAIGLNVRNRTYQDNEYSYNKKLSKRKKKRASSKLPYILERTDIWCDDAALYITFRLIWIHLDPAPKTSLPTDNDDAVFLEMSSYQDEIQNATNPILEKLLQKHLFIQIQSKILDCMAHIASHVLQDRLRNILTQTPKPQPPDNKNQSNINNRDNRNMVNNVPYLTKDHGLNAIAFLTNGSILPRKSGTSTKPMASPPAIPLSAPSYQTPLNEVKNRNAEPRKQNAPTTSALKATVFIDMGSTLGQFLNIDNHYKCGIKIFEPDSNTVNSETTKKRIHCSHCWNVKLTGLLIPRGITLIVGGGYHGKVSHKRLSQLSGKNVERNNNIFNNFGVIHLFIPLRKLCDVFTGLKPSHEKSTLLRAIAIGIHNKIPGDGREYCVTTQSAITIRAEDGRYIQNCNISAFISNLPFSAKCEQLQTNSDSNIFTTRIDSGIKPPMSQSNSMFTSTKTKSFSTMEASGSTSQAANVSEAIEMGATALLVDEDVCAANFMARDGRMRSLVADESITPLLYRVNGLFHSSKVIRKKYIYGSNTFEGGVSTVVVVGGVGDWLDVPDNVILMDRYQVYDATKKAKSISETFSYGHIQYGGRGVVHRLEWDDEGTPMQRRPLITFQPAPSDSILQHAVTKNSNSSNGKNKCKHWGLGVMISIDAGGSRLYLDPIYPEYNNDDNDEIDENNEHQQFCGNEESDNDDDEDEDDLGMIDMGRCEQLFGSAHELYGCGMCLAWLLKYASEHQHMGTQELLHHLDLLLDKQNGHGMKELQNMQKLCEKENLQVDCGQLPSLGTMMIKCVGFAYRPRRFEVAMALNRMRGLSFENIISIDDYGDQAAAAKLEAERKKQELLAIWNARRKPKRFNEQFKK